jgi:hypothetical protein
MALGNPARDYAIALGDLVDDPDLEIPVREEQLVERKRSANSCVPVVIARVDVV